VLRDPLARVEYLLEIEGQRKEGEKSSKPRLNFSKSFELNESLDELRETKNPAENFDRTEKTELQSVEGKFSGESRRSRCAASVRAKRMGHPPSSQRGCGRTQKTICPA